MKWEKRSRLTRSRTCVMQILLEKPGNLPPYFKVSKAMRTSSELITLALTPWGKFRKYMWFWGKSENTFRLLQWVSMRNRIFEHGPKLRPFVSKIIWQKYTSQWIDPNYVLVFTVCLGMAQILTDSPTGCKQKLKNHMVIVDFLFGNLRISEPSPDIL